MIKIFSTVTLLLISSFTGVAHALLPPANIGTVPFDHDKFLQFAESGMSDNVTSGDAYYQAVDPNNQRITLDEWKVLNGFIEPLPNTSSGLAAAGIEHALYRNATDLGFVRNIYMRVKSNGDVVALLENFPGFDRTIDQSFDEVTNGCSVPFNPALPKEQRCTSGGIDAFENRDLSGMLASVVMEYSAVTPGGPKFTQFYGYGNDGNRVSAIDLTGRGKAEAFPGLCGTCHGGYPGGVDVTGEFISHDFELHGAEDGNFGGGFLPFDPDLYEFHDPLVAGVEVGSGQYSRANQEASFKELNRIVLVTDPTEATRELVEGWYGGPGLPTAFNGNYIPDGWIIGTAQDKTFYKTVIAPYCRACHIQRAYPESTPNSNAHPSGFNAQNGSQLDFNHVSDLIWLRNQIGNTVFKNTTMPLALVTYKKFWSDTVAVQNFIDYLPGYIPSSAGVAVMPGKPIADPGHYVDQVVGQLLQLDGSGSMSADNFSWSVTPSVGVTLTNALTKTPTFVATIPGLYTITLTVSNNAVIIDGVSRPADTSDPVSVQVKVAEAPFGKATFQSAILPSSSHSRCLECHSQPDRAGNEDFNLYRDMKQLSALTNIATVHGNPVSRLLYKPAGFLADNSVSYGVHGGGKIIHEDGEFYRTLKNWIEDGECEFESGCQRLSVTNENTPLNIDTLSPFLDQGLIVSVSGLQPSHGTLSLSAGPILTYTPDKDFSGLDSYSYLLTDSITGSSRLVTDNIYVFPAIDTIPLALNQTISSQFSGYIPDDNSLFEFEKVNADGDVLPNYLDDFPNNSLISVDTDGDGLADDFNSNITMAQSSASGILIDDDDDNDGVIDINDQYPLDSLRSIYIDTDNDGIEDAFDPYPSDMLMAGAIDTDSDGASDALDNCPLDANTNQSDIDSDNFGDVCDSDADGDGAANNADAFPFDPAAILDSDGDGYPDALLTGVTSLSIPPLILDLEPGSATGILDPDGDGVGNHAIYTIAGTGTYGNTGDGGPATSARLTYPYGIAVDTSGNRFISDAANNVVRRIDALTGVITTIAGIGIAGFSGDGGLATAAQLSYPTELALDSFGNLFIADNNNYRIRRIDVNTGVISTIAGTGIYGTAGDGNLASAAQISPPSSLAIDAVNNIYIGQLYKIRRIDAATGIITTVIGTGGYGSTGDGGPANLATLKSSEAIALDTAGNIYIADLNQIRKVDVVSNIISTVVGTGVAGSKGDGGLAINAEISSPQGLAIDVAGNIYIGANSQVRRVDSVTGIIETIAGSSATAYTASGDGGLASDAELTYIFFMHFDNTDKLLVSTSASVRLLALAAASDAFPYDPAASIDTDRDGFPDQYNLNATTAQINASGLVLDAFATDSTASIDTDNDGMPDYFIVSSDLLSPLLLTEDMDDDNDGLNDVVELGLGTNIQNIDTDGDGLSDTDEVNIYFTNPLNIDTDSDGFSDLVEVTEGSNPVSALDVPADGDINNDGVVNTVDVLLATQFSLGLKIPAANEMLYGDVAPLINGVPQPDGKINAGDLLLIQQKALGQINF